jgi:branched-chain amino acid transport system ATP-binding protein
MADSPVSVEPGADNLLEVEHLRIQYGGVVAIDDVSFSINAGTVVGLIGPNGAGKTTLVDALTGYVHPTAGHIRFSGVDITKLPVHRRARAGLVRTFQSVELFDDLTVQENLRVAHEPSNVLRAIGQVFLRGKNAVNETVERVLTMTDLTSVAHRMPSELSLGQRKLVGVARSLAQNPKLVLLDEPAAGLDTDETQLLGQRIARLPENGVTVLLIDHDMSLVLNICQIVNVLDFGKLIAQGTPREVRSSPAVIEAYLGSSEGASGE